MKICIFTTDYPPTVGGIVAHTVRLSEALADSNDVQHVQIVALKNRLSGSEDISGKLSFIRSDTRSILGIFFDTIRYAWKFRRYEIFHATSVFPMGFFTLLIGKYLLRKQVVVSFYGTDVLTSEGRWYTKWAKGFTLRHASAAIALSYSTRDRTAQKYGLKPESFPVISTFIADPIVSDDVMSRAEGIQAKLGIGHGDFVVLFVGNLVKRKGAELLPRALATIGDPAVKLIIVGDGPERTRLERRIIELGLSDRVFLTGRVSDVEPYYFLADVFSMPSFFEPMSGDIEGLGIVYIEAQQRGVPVIGTHSGGIPEAIDKDRSGFIVAENDIEGLARRIVMLRDDPDLRREMGERGRVFVREMFHPARTIAAHIAVYKSVVKG